MARRFISHEMLLELELFGQRWLVPSELQEFADRYGCDVWPVAAALDRIRAVQQARSALACDAMIVDLPLSYAARCRTLT